MTTAQQVSGSPGTASINSASTKPAARNTATLFTSAKFSTGSGNSAFSILRRKSIGIVQTPLLSPPKSFWPIRRNGDMARSAFFQPAATQQPQKNVSARSSGPRSKKRGIGHAVVRGPGSVLRDRRSHLHFVTGFAD
jgi:hypothetical protein